MSGDPLGVQRSTQVLLNTGPVRIDRRAARKFAETLEVGTVRSSEPAPFFYEDWTVEDQIAIVLAFNAINFCFWAEMGQPTWVANDESGNELSGSSAVRYSLERAYRHRTIDLGDAGALAETGTEDLEAIFPPQNGSQLPMLSERAQCLIELGQALLDWPAPTFLGWEEGAVGLVQALALHVPNFNDVHRFRGEEIRLYKRAQVTAKMVHGVLERSGIHEGFLDLDDLTAFADYRVPQILREKRILVYDPGLADKVDQQEEIEAGSHEELAIRACTIWAVEYLRQELEGLHPGQKLNASDVDGFLWLEARRLKDDMRPHHRTKTIFY